MSKKTQIRKADNFLALHHDPKLLVLPNIWDPLGARLLQSLGYPAVATASAAVAYSLGYDDGQRISFAVMLDVIGRIATSVGIPVTADIESGYAEQPQEVADNVRRVMRAGAVGINLEDSTIEGGPLRSIDVQCDRIRAVRDMANREGVHLVINARIDLFLSEGTEPRTDRVSETIARAKAYIEAGADCVYPILVGDVDTLSVIRQETRAPINVYASASAAPMRDLEKAGISRLSLGPGLIKASLTTMKNVASELMEYGTYDSFTNEVMTSDEIAGYVSKDKMS
ncbi:MAG: isocitrate lyase/phosphoenolpyruvate mutase family protein [Candidatus Krumholzibacteria bacterium]|nr:isocitrate lyase/phosphoenolpyruvate mutase family protein [Candidatus Krumholzibacteria bacterium]